MNYRTEDRSVTFGSLVGENAFTVLATMRRLLWRLSQETGAGDVSAAYAEEAKAGNYDHLLRVSHRYAYEYLRTTLSVQEDFDAYTIDDDEEEYR